MVGAPRFELGTSCAQGSSRNAKLLVRLAFSYVMHHGFARYSSMFVPKLFPTFGVGLPSLLQATTSTISIPPTQMDESAERACFVLWVFHCTMLTRFLSLVISWALLRTGLFNCRRTDAAEEWYTSCACNLFGGI